MPIRCGRPLREVDVVLNTDLASTLEQSKQRRPLGRSRPAPDHDYDPAMREPGCEFEKIVSVAGQEYTPAFVRESKDRLIGRISREDFAQQCHIVTKLFQQIAQVLGHIMVEQELSLRGHLPGDQQIDLAAVILIIGKTLINLRARELGKTVRRHRFYGLAILKQANDVVNTDSSALNDRVATPHAG